MRFTVSHAKNAHFETDGLRPYYRYRDLGIAKATDGKVQAHVIQAVPAQTGTSGRHTHTLEFQLVYILKGWVRFWYEGQGEVLLEPGDCVHQPPGIRHEEMGRSDDLELLEITMPAEFETRPA